MLPIEVLKGGEKATLFRRRTRIRKSQGCVILQGMVNVAAVDCDDASLKSLCGKYGVQGFPTLKVSCYYLTPPWKMQKSSVLPDKCGMLIPQQFNNQLQCCSAET